MTRLADMPQATQAGILCNDPQFQQFAASQSGFRGGQFTTQAAAEYLRTDFDAWIGKIARQR